MTYNVFGGTLSLSQSINQAPITANNFLALYRVFSFKDGANMRECVSQVRSVYSI